jgi:hypothetical protein
MFSTDRPDFRGFRERRRPHGFVRSSGGVFITIDDPLATAGILGPRENPHADRGDQAVIGASTASVRCGQRRAPRVAHRLALFLVEQGHGVGDAGDEAAQAGEQQQFFDLPDHDSPPPEKVSETRTTTSGNLGSTAGIGIPSRKGTAGRQSDPFRNVSAVQM